MVCTTRGLRRGVRAHSSRFPENHAQPTVGPDRRGVFERNRARCSVLVDLSAGVWKQKRKDREEDVGGHAARESRLQGDDESRDVLVTGGQGKRGRGRRRDWRRQTHALRCLAYHWTPSSAGLLRCCCCHANTGTLARPGCRVAGSRGAADLVLHQHHRWCIQ